MNWPLNVLVQWQFVFKLSSSSCCSHFDIMRPRRHLTIDHQYLAIARLQMGCSQREAATELKVSQSVISRLQQRHRETGRVTERHRSGRPLTASLWTVPSGTGLWMPLISRHVWWKWEAPECHVRPFETAYISMVCVLDDLQGYLTTPPGTGVIVREHLRWTRNQWASVLFSDESRFTLRRNDGHQRCCLVLKSGQKCLVNTELWMVLWQVNTTWITSLIQSLCLFMSNTGLISSSWMTMPQLIAFTSSGNDYWRLGYFKLSGLHFLQNWIP